ncbi:long-chain fatty acid--CoA ligase, partial [Mycobacterium tuberculosis]|nr:long-chain fatty acid--CoA ligase [Mycobacterium tuberculosis]
LDVSRPKVYVYDTELTDMVSAALERAEHTPEVLIGVGTGELVGSGDSGPRSIRFADLAADGTPPQTTRRVFDETTRLYT